MVVRSESPGARIPQFFAGRAVFITGATGFMGKVLVERLLTTCPDIGNLFLLMRDKAGVKPQERLMGLKRSQVYDVLRETNPGQLDKLRIVCGDISKPGLGVSNDSLVDLEEVSVVFNCAATVRFDEPLRPAAEQNVLSVIRLMDLCDRLPRLQSFVHVSTGYCNAERACVAERVYPLPNSFPSVLADTLAVPDHTPPEEVKRIVSPKPNSYTYTKMLGESAVAERTRRRYPAAIFRPTIVIGSLRHPFPGWIDNFNGPSGVLVAIMSGLLHVFRCDPSGRADLLPVDFAIDTLIALAWETAIDNLPTVRVYNGSTLENPTYWRDMLTVALEDSRQNPLPDVAWYPSCFITKNRFIYETLKFFCQTVPFHIVEYVMRIFNHKKNRLNLIKIHARLCGMNNVLDFFATREWNFSTDNVRRLRARLSPEDAAIFNLDPMSIDWKDLLKNLVRGCRLYLARHKEETLPEARTRLQRLYLVHRAITILLPVLVLCRLVNPLDLGAAILSSASKLSNVVVQWWREL